MVIRAYRPADLPDMIRIWNEVVAEGNAFPFEDGFDSETGAEYFASQTFTAVAEDKNGAISGLYVLHPNYIGRCGHIANASYAVDSRHRGQHTGEKLVLDSLARAKELGFSVMQFNAVVESNIRARHLYERLGFQPLGKIPGGFRMKDGHFENVCPYYRTL